jgi:hypothetical protein
MSVVDLPIERGTGEAVETSPVHVVPQAPDAATGRQVDGDAEAAVIQSAVDVAAAEAEGVMAIHQLNGLQRREGVVRRDIQVSEQGDFLVLSARGPQARAAYQFQQAAQRLHGAEQGLRIIIESQEHCEFSSFERQYPLGMRIAARETAERHRREAEAARQAQALREMGLVSEEWELRAEEERLAAEAGHRLPAQKKSRKRGTAIAVAIGIGVALAGLILAAFMTFALMIAWPVGLGVVVAGLAVGAVICGLAIYMNRQPNPPPVIERSVLAGAPVLDGLEREHGRGGVRAVMGWNPRLGPNVPAPSVLDEPVPVVPQRIPRPVVV